MAFSDGDPFVSGSLYSFQQGNRMMQNYRGASVPSNLQDGALWSDSDDDRLWHQGATLDEVFTEQTTLTWENLLSNSGFGVWSQSDTSKGLATITYDTGAKGAGTAPSVGDAIVGANGATAKLISYTTASGTWAGGNAAGVLTVGAVSHNFAFVDNEILTFDGVETAAVNRPDSAVQVGLFQNGGFATDTDPPPGWTAVTATLTTEAGGQVGNCMQVASSGAALGKAYQDITTVIGKIYKLSLYFKKGTSDTGKFMVGITSDEDSIYDSGDLSDAGWTAYTYTFEATATTTRITMQTTDATITENSLFDEISCYEITPGCTAADAKAFDGSYKDTTIDLYRQHNDGGTLTKDGSFYSLKCVPTTADDFVIFPLSAIRDNEEWYQQFAGRTVTFGCWAKTSTASHFFIQLIDSDTTDYDQSSDGSSYHTGGGAWEWLEVSMVISASTTEFSVAFVFDATQAVNGDTIVYISQPMLVLGAYIGEGNYQPKQQEIIWMRTFVSSNKYTNLLNQSDTAMAELNIEADSDGMIPKGVKAIYIWSQMNDSGSLGANHYFLITPDFARINWGIYNSAYGLPNDFAVYRGGWMICDDKGDVECQIEATGANTFDVKKLRFYGVQIN